MATSPVSSRPVPALNLDAAIRLMARLLGAAAVVVFAILVWREGIPRSVEPRQWEILAQVGVLGLVIAGYIFAWRWEVAGGITLIVGAIILGILASISYEPRDAFVGALVFLVPGVLFLLHWQRRHSWLAFVTLSALLAAFLALGGFASPRVYSHYYGPFHPESGTPRLSVDRIEWVWAGAVTGHSFVVKARIADDDVREASLFVEAIDETAASVIVPGHAAVEDDSIFAFDVRGLQPGTLYRYTVTTPGGIEQNRIGTVHTFAAEGQPASFTIAIGACLRTGSNGMVFDAIRAANPLLFMVTGDFHYEDISSDDPRRMSAAFQRNLEQAAQQALYLRAPIAYVWDDHDYGGNDSNAATESRLAAATTFREFVPHYDLTAADGVGVYQAFSIGRTRFILTDGRSARDAALGTMLGDEQKAWLKRELLAASGVHPVIVLVTDVPWVAAAKPGDDSWAGFAEERAEIATFIAANEIHGVAIVSGDAHMVAIDDGSNSAYSAVPGDPIPALQAGALDRRGTLKGGPFSEGMYPGAGQFATMTVTDDGSGPVHVLWVGMNYLGEEIVRFEFTVPGSGR